MGRSISRASRLPHPLLGLGLGAIVCGAAVLRYGIKGRSSQMFGRSFHRGDGRRRSIALTFDDGPSTATLELAALLEDEGVRATFFQCGANVLRFPDVTRHLCRVGHEIGNHTFSHRRLCPRVGWQMNLLSPAEIYNEIAKTQRVVEEVAGVRPAWFRAPYGMRWIGLRSALNRTGLAGVMWTVIAHDWEWEAARVVDHVLSRVSPGGILCFHDGRETRSDPDVSVMLEAVQIIIPALKTLGYSFETVSDLLQSDRMQPD